MKPEKFRITLGYLNGDMHIPNNKNIIFLLDSGKRKFKTSKNNRWNFSNRIDTVDLRMIPTGIAVDLSAICKDILVGVNLFKSSLQYKERGITLTPAPRSHKLVLT